MIGLNGTRLDGHTILDIRDGNVLINWQRVHRLRGRGLRIE
ncbi:hypothetical protein ACHAWC_008268 [Mediolabrus comicus]